MIYVLTYPDESDQMSDMATKWRKLRNDFSDGEFDPPEVLQWGDKAAAEIERLTRCIELCEENNERIGKEIELLRGLLREAEKMWPNPGLSPEWASWYRRVREALGE